MIDVDIAGCLTDRVGDHGIDPSRLSAAEPALAQLTAELDETRGTGWERWRTLVEAPMRRAHTEAVGALCDRYREGCRNLVVLGIGGSALGGAALQMALNPPTWNALPPEARNGPRLFILDNIDPALVRDTLDLVQADDPAFEHTVINVISKSGETAETAAQYLVIRDVLRRALGDSAGSRIIATTDAGGGTLRAIADREGYATLPVPEGVGGRFSVLSPVGLFSAAMCGIDIEALLAGAAEMESRCRRADLTNPAAVLAWILTEFTRHGKPNHVLMPYRSALTGLADWFRQLWAESLGKRLDTNGAEVFAGATPISALGATDQHSQIQLYREGPNDKVIGFVETATFEPDVQIPSGAGIAALDYLEGSSLGALLAAEKRATEYALTESARPHFTIRLDRIDAHHVGAFLQLWMVTTAFAARLLGVNAYDQPAVETGKQATFGLMGRTGFGDVEDRVRRALAAPRWL